MRWRIRIRRIYSSSSSRRGRKNEKKDRIKEEIREKKEVGGGGNRHLTVIKNTSKMKRTKVGSGTVTFGIIIVAQLVNRIGGT